MKRLMKRGRVFDWELKNFVIFFLLTFLQRCEKFYLEWRKIMRLKTSPNEYIKSVLPPAAMFYSGDLVYLTYISGELSINLMCFLKSRNKWDVRWFTWEIKKIDTIFISIKIEQSELTNYLSNRGTRLHKKIVFWL